MTVARRSRSGDRRDGGQLLLLAGFILILMFVSASITLSKLSNVEADVAREHRAPIVDEFEFVRSRVNSTMNNLVDTDTTNSSFNDTLASMRGSFQDVENQKGYDLVLELGGVDTPAPKTEDPHFVDTATSPLEYENVSFDGQRDFDGQDYDGVNDGILWYKESGDSSGHIKGFVAYIYLADHRSRIESTVLFAVNTD